MTPVPVALALCAPIALPVRRDVRSATPADVVERIGRAAVAALHDELSLEPKPGLVSFRDSGSHHDMDATTFMRSLQSLSCYFPDMARLGASGSDWATLEHRGQRAEQRMMAATGGVNTHRGAVFLLGILCAAAGHAAAQGRALTAVAIRQTAMTRWGVDLRQRASRLPLLPGGIAARRLGLRGASREAADGFPVLFDVAFPTLKLALLEGRPQRQAQLLCLLASMAVLDDCNVAQRGGLDALRYVQASATHLLSQGLNDVALVRHLRVLHDQLVERHLSPGGAADTLAAACWLNRICAP